MFSTNVGVLAVVLWLKCVPSLTTGKSGGVWAGLKGKVLGRGRAREELQIVGGRYWLRACKAVLRPGWREKRMDLRTASGFRPVAATDNCWAESG